MQLVSHNQDKSFQVYFEGKGEATSLTPLFHFQLLQISWAVGMVEHFSYSYIMRMLFWEYWSQKYLCGLIFASHQCSTQNQEVFLEPLCTLNVHAGYLKLR